MKYLDCNRSLIRICNFQVFSQHENYDLRKTNARYKAVINNAQLAVLHLQTVSTEDTSDVSQLSLCPGILEFDTQLPCQHSKL